MANVELNHFKETINLSEYAASCGYVMDRKESSRNSVVMRHLTTHDKIVIARNSNGHWIYFSVHDDQDNGTIIDFVQYRDGLTLGAVRQRLRPWVGQGGAKSSVPLLKHYAQSIEPSSSNALAVVKAFSQMQMIDQSAYLEQERSLPHAVLQHPRFAGTIRQDQRGNTVFAHHNQQGLCGYELKNTHFTGFSPAGEKGLWASHAKKSDHCLVIAESAINALSYFALHPDEHSRYFSFAGSLNPNQPRLIQSAIERMQTGSTIILATDADTAGEKFSQQLTTLVHEIQRQDLLLRSHSPLHVGTDWNDQLKATPKDNPLLFPIARQIL